MKSVLFLALTLFTAANSYACELPSAATILNGFREYGRYAENIDQDLENIPLMPRGMMVQFALSRAAQASRLDMPQAPNLEYLVRMGMRKFPACAQLVNDQLRDTFGIPTPKVWAHRDSARCIANGVAVANKTLHCRIR